MYLCVQKTANHSERGLTFVYFSFLCLKCLKEIHTKTTITKIINGGDVKGTEGGSVK